MNEHKAITARLNSLVGITKPKGKNGMKTITFSVTSYFDPYGDGKSPRKVLSRKFYHTHLTEEQVLERFSDQLKLYYSGVSLTFKPYKRTQLFK